MTLEEEEKEAGRSQDHRAKKEVHVYDPSIVNVNSV